MAADEFCPLRLGGPTFDTYECSVPCQDLWDKAVLADDVSGPYDDYVRQDAERGYGTEGCAHIQAEFSHDALFAVDKYLRQYVIVDSCAGCGDELGEQAYKFICPLPLEG